MNHWNQYLLDSDTLIEYLRGREQALAFFSNLVGNLAVSVITVAELYAGVRNDRERQILADFLAMLTIIPVDRAIAERGGLYCRQYKQSHGTGLDNALIAATAVTTGSRLVSFNRRHFPMITDLVVPYER